MSKKQNPKSFESKPNGSFIYQYKINKVMKENFSAVVHKEEDMYVAECPEVGTVSQGKTVEEAILNLKESTELYLEEFM